MSWSGGRKWVRLACAASASDAVCQVNACPAACDVSLNHRKRPNAILFSKLEEEE